MVHIVRQAIPGFNKKNTLDKKGAAEPQGRVVKREEGREEHGEHKVIGTEAQQDIPMLQEAS